MGKGSYYHRALALTPRYCLGCQKPIVFGDRCPPCQQRLRQRKRRKPR